MTKKDLRLLEDELDGEHGVSKEERAAAKEDSRVGSAVRELLEREGYAPPRQVHVVSKDGWVHIFGEVSWLRGMPEAEEAIRGLPGVLSVTNDIILRPYESAMDLKSRIVDALVNQAHRRASRIAVEGHDGRVSLCGTVASAREAEVAVDVAKRAPGVKVVEDLLEVQVPG